MNFLPQMQSKFTGSTLAAAAGFAAGLCWVAASYGINYLFERRPLRLWLINGGYHVLQFTAFGLNCSHLGCPVNWRPDAQLFLCPCHGGRAVRASSPRAVPDVTPSPPGCARQCPRPLSPTRKRKRQSVTRRCGS